MKWPAIDIHLCRYQLMELIDHAIVSDEEHNFLLFYLTLEDLFSIILIFCLIHPSHRLQYLSWSSSQPSIHTTSSVVVLFKVLCIKYQVFRNATSPNNGVSLSEHLIRPESRQVSTFYCSILYGRHHCTRVSFRLTASKCPSGFIGLICCSKLSHIPSVIFTEL